jgi:hypothetical protein
VTNALQASWALEERPPNGLRLLADGERLLIKVWDRSPVEPMGVPGTPHRMAAGPGDSGGSERPMGFQRMSYTMKLVWFELALTHMDSRNSPF